MDGVLRWRRRRLWPLEPGKYRLYRWSAARSVHRHNNSGRSWLSRDRGVGGGCDYQFPVGGWNFVVGAFGDYDWSSIKGHLNPPAAIGLVGDEKMSSAWSVGGRVGWVVLPSFLTYFTAGYTQATFDRTNLSVAFGPPFLPVGLPANALIDKKNL